MRGFNQVGRARAFFSVPPFPKRACRDFTPTQVASELSDVELRHLVDQIRQARVGGAYWGGQPELGAAHRLVGAANFVTGESELDPWHVLASAKELSSEADDQLQLIAGILGVPIRPHDRSAPARRLEDQHVCRLLRQTLGPNLPSSPFTGEPLPWFDVVALCHMWRDLIDANRSIAAVYGFASWKRATTEPLLWDGSNIQRFDRKLSELRPGQAVAAWRSRTSAARLAEFDRASVQLIEVEDGFIRSAGLGANCVPPQSIVVDPDGIYFDPRSPSRLETLLQNGQFTPELLARAQALQERIATLGISKYDRGDERLARRSDWPHVLVTGQVEDDRAVLSSIGPPLSNLDLIRQVRAARPNAYLLYKPHPDVEAGHRKGAVPDGIAVQFANEVVRDGSIASWIDLADAVHVNSSLAGFEALMRGKPVTTYGVPFYAGWGLTEDLGPVPARRSARRSLTELVAAALILYPRYVDPITNLPCPPELVVERLGEGAAKTDRRSPLVLARQLQGWLQRLLQHSTTMP